MMLQLRSRRWSVAVGARAAAAAASSCRRRCPRRHAASAAGGVAADAAAGEASGRRLRRRRSPGTGLPRSPDRRCSGTAAGRDLHQRNTKRQSVSQLAPTKAGNTGNSRAGNKRRCDADTHLWMPGAERQRQVVGDLQGRRRRRRRRQHLGLLGARVQLPPGGS